MIYRLLFRLGLRRLDAETAHALASRTLRLLLGLPLFGAATRRALGRPDPALRVEALGSVFATPLGAAAGIDKDASWFDALGALGFGFVEVGTVTAHGQEGNPRPRVARLIPERALLNRMGFPNPGAAAVAAHLASRTTPTVVGVNVGKSRTVELDDAEADLRATARALARAADYVVVNVSSPNTPGLRDLQSVDRLRGLLTAVREEMGAVGADIPVLVKLAPDLTDDELDEIADLCVELEADGIVAVNTTVERGTLTTPASRGEAERFGQGGLSGAPLKPRALAVLRRLRARTDDRLVLVSVGGIDTPADAWERILTGASLVQAYTGFVYGGPLWARRMNRGLAALLRASPWDTIGDAVGAGMARSERPGAPRG